MSIRVLFFASLADAVRMQETKLEADTFTDVASIFDHFIRTYPPLEKYRSYALFAINSEFARPDSPVHDGDEIAIFPPFSGG